MDTPICPYCNKPSVQVGGSEIYPTRRDLYHKVFYLCKPCDAMVGCHPGTVKPLGRLANAELRRAKQRAHAAFDPFWKANPAMKRHMAYKWLSEQLGISQEDCHIGMFDLEMCDRVVDIFK